jgi:hypothetical protein
MLPAHHTNNAAIHKEKHFRDTKTYIGKIILKMENSGLNRTQVQMLAMEGPTNP